MKVLFNKLHKYNIEKLIFNSLEQVLYQPSVVIDGEEHVVWENKNKTMSSYNLMTLRESFSTLNIQEVCLRHESPYDEMVGQPGKPETNRLEVPLGKITTKLPSRLN